MTKVSKRLANRAREAMAQEDSEVEDITALLLYGCKGYNSLSIDELREELEDRTEGTELGQKVKTATFKELVENIIGRA